jgi:hypothetical protein
VARNIVKYQQIAGGRLESLRFLERTYLKNFFAVTIPSLRIALPSLLSMKEAFG